MHGILALRSGALLSIANQINYSVICATQQTLMITNERPTFSTITLIKNSSPFIDCLHSL